MRGKEVDLGFCSYSVLPFDSEILGFTVGRVTDINELDEKLAAELIKSLQGSSVRYVTCRIDGSEVVKIQLLEDAGFRYLDTTLSMRSPGLDIPSRRNRHEIVKATEEDIPRIQKMAGIFTSSRFYKDSLTRVNYAKMYEQWIRNSVLGEVADEVYYVGNQKVEGFIALEDVSGRGHIPLVGSMKNGVGSELLGFAFEWFEEHNCDEVLIEGQADNARAIYLYEKYGFRVYKSEQTLRWSDL